MKQRFFLLLVTLLTTTTMQALTPQPGDTWDGSTKTLTVNSNPRAEAYAFNDEIEKVIFSNSVTEIGRYAFSDCRSLASITFSFSVTTIGDWAFNYCAITSVNIPEGVSSIGLNPFSYCRELTSINVSPGNTKYKSIDGVLFTIDGKKMVAYPVGNSRTSYTIPEGVTSAIGAFDFLYLSLKTLNIPSSLTDKSFFDDLTTQGGLATINVAAEHPKYKSMDGVLFSKDGKELVFYPKINTRTSYTIPDGVTSLADGSFSNCLALSSVTIPSSVTSIGGSVFRECRNLKSVTIPDYVTAIGRAAFEGCISIESITIPKGVTSIEDYVFSGCTNLKSISFGPNITNIGKSAFHSCASLSSFTIPSSVTSVGVGAFAECNNLATMEFHCKDIDSHWFYVSRWYDDITLFSIRTIIIGDEVKTLGERGFRDFDNLESIHISNVATWCNFDFKDQYDNPLYNNKTKLYLNGKEVVDLVIPDGVKSVGKFCFCGYKGLASVTIPNSVTHIGKDAFAYWFGDLLVNITDLSAWCNIDFENQFANPFSDSYAWLYLNGKWIINLYIPDDVTSIGKYTFCGYQGVEVTIPHHITSICDSAFYSSAMEKLTIGNSVASIGKKAFGGTNFFFDVYCYAEKVPMTVADAFEEFYRDEVTLHVPTASIDDYKSSEPWSNFKNIVPLEVKPTNKGYGVDYTKDIDKNACLDGFMLDNVFYSINDEDGTYDSENGCIVLNKPTADATVKGLIGKDIFSKEFRDIFTGIVLKLAPGSGYVNVNAETTGDLALKIKIGNDAPKTTDLDGKQTTSFQYNVTEETYVYIYAGDKTTQARNTRAESTDNSLKLYSIGISDTANDINSITIDSANTFIYDLQGNKLNKVRKGMNIIRTKESSTRKIVVK